MVTIEIDDEVWELYKKSWALLGVRAHYELVRILEIDMQERSSDAIEDAKNHLIDDTPEAYVQREIGLQKEREERKK